MMSLRLSISIAVLSLQMLSCGTPLTAGGATDSPNAIAGVVIDPESGRPAPGVHVYLLRDTKRDTTGVKLTHWGSAMPLDSTKTDSSGQYTFSTLHKGIFALLGLTLTRKSVIFIDGIVVNETDVRIDPAQLTPAGAISGVVKLPKGPQHHALLVGTNYQVPIDDHGRFTISGLPADTFLLWTVLSYPDGNIFNFATFNRVAVTPGQTVTLDTLTVATITHASDTLTISDCDGSAQNNGGGVWWRSLSDASTYDTIPLCSEGGRDGGNAATMRYTLGPDDKVVTIGKNTGLAHRPLGYPDYGYKQSCDLSAVKGLSFWIRAEGADTVTVSFHSTLVSNWNDLATRPLPLTSDWQHVTIATDTDLAHLFDMAVPRSWSDVSRAIDAIMFHITHNYAGESGQIWIDDVKLLF